MFQYKGLKSRNHGVFPVVSIFHLQSSQFRRSVVEVIVEGYFLKPDEVGFNTIWPESWRWKAEKKWWGSKVVVFKSAFPLFFSKTKKTALRNRSDIWCSCWWFRNPKQPPGMYETMVQQSRDLIFLQVNIPPLSRRFWRWPGQVKRLWISTSFFP